MAPAPRCGPCDASLRETPPCLPLAASSVALALLPSSSKLRTDLVQHQERFVVQICLNVTQIYSGQIRTCFTFFSFFAHSSDPWLSHRQKCIGVLKALSDDTAEALTIFLKLDNRQTQR